MLSQLSQFNRLGNRRKGTDAAQLGHDDEVYGTETRASLEDLPFGESCKGSATGGLIVDAFGHRSSVATVSMISTNVTQREADKGPVWTDKSRHRRRFTSTGDGFSMDVVEFVVLFKWSPAVK